MNDYFLRVTLHAASRRRRRPMVTAVLELALAVIALYGLIAFAASHRRREIGPADGAWRIEPVIMRIMSEA